MDIRLADALHATLHDDLPIFIDVHAHGAAGGVDLHVCIAQAE